MGIIMPPSTNTQPTENQTAWTKFLGWFNRSWLASFLRTFVAALLTVTLADWQSTGTISFTKWVSYLIAAVVAALPVILRALNPVDPAFTKST